MVSNCCSAPGGGSGPDQLVVETTGPLAGLGDGTFAGADGCFLLAMLTGDDRRERAPNSHHITSDALQIAALRAAEGVAVAHRCRQSHPAQDRPEKGIFASGGLHGLTNSWKSTLSQGCKFLPRLDYGARRAESGWATGNESRVLGACHTGKWARTVVLPWNTCWHARKQCARSKPMRWNEWRRTPETAGFFAAEWTTRIENEWIHGKVCRRRLRTALLPEEKHQRHCNPEARNRRNSRPVESRRVAGKGAKTWQNV